MAWNTLVDVLRDRALAQEQKTAFTTLADDGTEAGSITFRDLDVSARAVAAHLQQAGASGERVLLLTPPGIEFITAFLGCLYAGSIAVPSYPPQPSRLEGGRSAAARLRAIVRDAVPSFTLTTPALEERVHALRADIGGEGVFQCLVPATSGASSSDWNDPQVGADAVAFLQYTSGTTGTPKGVPVTHANLLHNLRLIEAALGITEADSGVNWLPPYHDMGLIGGMLQPLYQGSSVVLVSPVSFLHRPFRWLEAMSRFGGTVSGGPDFAYELCARRVTPEQKASLDLSRWRVALNGAEPIRPATLKAFTEAFAPCGFSPQAWAPCYGLAEATLFVCGGPRGAKPLTRRFNTDVLEHAGRAALTTDPGGRDLVPCGTPPDGLRVLIVNPETRMPCPDEQVGEIWVQGRSVGQGYWNGDTRSDETFGVHLASDEGGPFLRTGDLGFFHDYELFALGRRADMIHAGKRSLAPQDIEATAEESHPALRRGGGAAFTVRAEGIEAVLVILLEVERQALVGLDAEGVKDVVRRVLRSKHGLEPVAVRLLKTATLPRTTSGKIQRRACRDLYLTGALEMLAAGEG